MNSAPLQEKLTAFLDIETLGLDPHKQEMIEIAILRSDGVTFVTKIRPLYPENADLRAIQVNGYNAKEWSDAPLMKDVAETFLGLLKDCIIIGQNVTFDISFLKVIAEQQNLKVNFNHHSIDTVTLAWEHLVPLGLNSLSLKSICLFLGIEPEPDQHRALAEATSCKRVYEKLVRATWWDRLWWKLCYAGRRSH